MICVQRWAGEFGFCEDFVLTETVVAYKDSLGGPVGAAKLLGTGVDKVDLAG